MPYLLTEDGVIVEDLNGVSWTDVIKQQRAVAASAARYAELDAKVEEVVEEVAQEIALPVYNANGSRTAPVMPSLDGNPKVDQRLQTAMELISEFTQAPPQPHPIHVTVENDNSGMQALVAALGQITERLMNGERVSESLVASLQSLAEMPAPVVNVEAPNVTVQSPEITMPDIHVAAPNVTVRPEITAPSVSKTVTFERDPLTGQVSKAEVTES